MTVSRNSFTAFGDSRLVTYPVRKWIESFSVPSLLTALAACACFGSPKLTEFSATALLKLYRTIKRLPSANWKCEQDVIAHASLVALKGSAKLWK